MWSCASPCNNILRERKRICSLAFSRKICGWYKIYSSDSSKEKSLVRACHLIYYNPINYDLVSCSQPKRIVLLFFKRKQSGQGITEAGGPLFASEW
jgi:hypothetical protein